ncbi:MAG: hypothetical protein J0H98_03450 [Solirubrobacterales bacterium]|nr:hypothetical protein [Solirubrobacterales bacterium]
MNRLRYQVTAVLAALGILAAPGLAEASAPGHATASDAGIEWGAADITGLSLDIPKQQVPATGVAYMRIKVRNDTDSEIENVVLRVRSSNWRVTTAQRITFQKIAPHSVARTGRIGVTPGRKARGKTTITVTAGDFEAADSIWVTRPTPGADAWKRVGRR